LLLLVCSCTCTKPQRPKPLGTPGRVGAASISGTAQVALRDGEAAKIQISLDAEIPER
jgi:hypothetical protein